MRYYSAQSGFSLVETLVAITLLLIVIVGPMTISTSAARSTSFASEQVIAFFLAQEGAELVQKVRDDKLVEVYAGASFDPWDAFKTELSHCFNGSCGLATTNTPDGQVSVTKCGLCRLYYDGLDTAERQRYTYIVSGNEPTIYIRNIQLREMVPGQVSVISKVTWRSGNFRDAQSAQVETYLYNIYD